MEIELFNVSNQLDTEIGFRKEHVATKFENAKIEGRQIVISTVADNFRPDYRNFYTKHPFTCKFEIPYEIKVVLNKGKNRYLNTEINYTDVNDGNERNYKVYTYLTCGQRFNEKRKRKLCWIQQASNIMWIVNVIVATLASIAAFKSA